MLKHALQSSRGHSRHKQAHASPCTELSSDDCLRRYNHNTGCVTLTTERHAHREDNRREVLRWLHLLIAEGHRAYPAEPRPELGLAWGPDGRRIDIQPWVDPDEALDSDAEYGSGVEYGSGAGHASDAEFASEADHASKAEHGGGAEHGQGEGVEGRPAGEGSASLAAKRPSDDASGNGAATERSAGAEARAEEGLDGGAALGEEVAEPRAGAGLESGAAERMGGSEMGVGTSGEGNDSSSSKRGELGAAAAAHPVGSAADGAAGTLSEATEEPGARPVGDARAGGAEQQPLSKP